MILYYSFNNYLIGKDGKALYQKIAGNNWKPVFDGNEVNPENGYDTVAALIKDNIYYTRPSRVCDICNECPMTWAGYLGELNGK